MNTLIKKFAPGVALCLAAALAVGFLRAQSATTETTAQRAPAPVYRPRADTPAACPETARLPGPGPIYGDYQAPRPIVVCGHCGHEIAAPAAVMVAQPLYRQTPPRSYPASYYEAPGRWEERRTYYGSPGPQNDAFRLAQLGLLPR
jgi:hypothetical protein